MGVADPLAGTGVEVVEREWRQLIASFAASDEVVLDLQKFVKPWDKAWQPSIEEARGALVEECTSWIEYVLNEPCSEAVFHNGVRDVGRASVMLADFITHANAREAGLSPAHVLSLRIYTTHLFRHAPRCLQRPLS